MPLLNYTTSISIEKTLGEIQAKLVKQGATSIMINYNQRREPESLSFIFSTKHGHLPFRLPANVAAIRAIMQRDRLPGYKTDGQAARVAWRIIKDWVEAQLALIESEMVSVEEVFLPYLLSGEKTLYQIMIEKGFYLPEGRGE